MTNVLETVSGVLKTIVDNETKMPLHVGEVMDLWKYLAYIEEIMVVEQIALHTTIDDELINLLSDAFKICSSQADQLKKVMKQEGVPLPASPEDKPNSEANAVPLGAKMTDNEIANILSVKLQTTVMECARKYD